MTSKPACRRTGSPHWPQSARPIFRSDAPRNISGYGRPACQLACCSMSSKGIRCSSPLADNSDKGEVEVCSCLHWPLSPRLLVLGSCTASTPSPRKCMSTSDKSRTCVSGRSSRSAKIQSASSPAEKLTLGTCTCMRSGSPVQRDFTKNSRCRAGQRERDHLRPGPTAGGGRFSEAHVPCLRLVALQTDCA
jgi:hypothetical protein